MTATPARSSHRDEPFAQPRPCLDTGSPALMSVRSRHYLYLSASRRTGSFAAYPLFPCVASMASEASETTKRKGPRTQATLATLATPTQPYIRTPAVPSVYPFPVSFCHFSRAP
ncbi:Piso0_005402 [Millerozyma farinosa CBS 7064]|uniref:Piso0_005402 protein n=1 Tax=Pichia sorbitophila (strain ATCC MYA-4447 / BCRC 22081 / CBS 7064 / NBRC 10061 / NRRL Y-12695) TaxID=559304 RepID=G8Y506_PICSO|nr:Piso0_005402 [Millerozyma farinosa CBS 7064]